MEKPMRIGAFARKHNVAISTVRYYIQCGYLVPERQNGQYLFDERCARDMEQIGRWKAMYFSLEDIHVLLSFKRRYAAPTRKDLDDYAAVCRRQLKALRERRAGLDEQIEQVRAMLESDEG